MRRKLKAITTLLEAKTNFLLECTLRNFSPRTVQWHEANLKGFTRQAPDKLDDIEPAIIKQFLLSQTHL